MTKQTFKEGTQVRFNSKDISQVEWDDADAGEITKYEGQNATIEGIDCWTKLGSKDYEYYCIRFEDGKSFEGISGYHLTPVK